MSELCKSANLSEGLVEWLDSRLLNQTHRLMDFVGIFHRWPGFNINILDRNPETLVNDMLLISHSEACVLGALLEVGWCLLFDIYDLLEVKLFEYLQALLQQLPRVVASVGIPALIYLHLLREGLLLGGAWRSKFQTDIMVLVVLHLDLLNNAINYVGSNNFDNLR